MERTKLACPKCGGTTFEVYHTGIENFHPPELGGSTTLFFALEKCIQCGWESNTTDRDEAKRRIGVLLLGEKPDWDHFVRAHEEVKHSDRPTRS